MSPGAPNRIVLDAVTPQVAGGRYPVKRVEGEPVSVGATVFADGHDALWVVVSHQAPEARGWSDVPMRPVNAGLDRWEGTFTPLNRGLHRFRVSAWVDHFASWADGTLRKLSADQPIESELLAGAALLEAAADGAARNEAALLRAAADRLREGETVDLTDPGGDERPSAARLYRRSLRRSAAATSEPVDVLVERERAQFSSWYELFPRSTFVGGHRADTETSRPTGAPPTTSSTHGTLRGVEAQLDHIAEMGFDIVYLPPIHPIGTSFRKGPNNAERAGPDDVGSPWAIGAPEGGHTAVHPALGTVEDLRHLVASAGEMGMEVALDLAFQCSPDHPWVTEHPEWFKHRPDGTIQYAENPPKKYQDIYPLDFESTEWRALWEALRDVALFWMDQGVTVFRVDNPHTKPFAFWEWFVAELRTVDPDVILLSEAFTRPEVMHRLTTVGFTQSYSYFAWRVSKAELTEYATEVSTSPGADRFRANFWPTTPDILPWHLHGARREMFALRHLLAATLSASYGIYGPAFELCDNRAAGNGKEEYLDSEKYQLRRWDLDDPVSLRDQIATVNRARRDQLALHTTRTLRFHHAPNDQLLVFSKTPHDGPDTDPTRAAGNPMLVVVNLDPAGSQAAVLDLDLAALGIDPTRPYDAHDLLTGRHFVWDGPHPYVELHPGERPGHVLRLSQNPSPAAPDGTPLG
jgi:starch synthase (maltosyl-transferring)